MSADLSWSLISGRKLSSSKGLVAEKNIIQLKGIFLSLDSNHDNFLTKSQLLDALVLLGLHPRTSLLKQLFPLGKVGEEVDFNTFVTVISKEKQEIGEDLDAIVAFLDPNDTGRISTEELRRLLILSGSATNGLTHQDFSNFLKSSNATDEIVVSQLKYDLAFHSI